MDALLLMLLLLLLFALGSSLVSMRSSAAMMSPRLRETSVLTNDDSDTFLKEIKQATRRGEEKV